MSKLTSSDYMRPLGQELSVTHKRILATLRPIKERLRLTDDLIGQIVYRLYGLTEEEIKLVEESKAHAAFSETHRGEDEPNEAD